MRNNVWTKGLVLGIIMLFVEASILPIISGSVGVTGINLIEKNHRTLNNGNRIEFVFNTTDDTMVTCHGDQDLPHGSLTDMEVRNDYGFLGTSGWEIDSLVKFNISSIPSDATILSGSLNLYYWGYIDNDPADRTLNLYRATTYWSEENTTWNNQPLYASQPTCNSRVPASTGFWMEWDVTNDIQSFVNGTMTNYGWKVTDDNYWGHGSIPTSCFRTKEYGNYIPYLNIKINLAPEIPMIDGPTSVKPNIAYQWYFTSNDPENDNVFYQINWGDGIITNWSGPYPSGQIDPETHTYTNKGTYTIKARAKDIHDKVSDWGIFPITVPCSFNVPFQPFWEWLFKWFPHAFPILRQLLGY
jgi:hypothetical protein